MYPYPFDYSKIISNDKEIASLYFKKLSSYLYPEIKLTERNFSDYLVQTSQDYDKIWEKLCYVLNKSFVGIVNNYFHCKRIQSIYKLDTRLEDILFLVKDFPYNVGMYRPDFLLEKETMQPKLCEIGARYPINGWMYTYYSMRVLEELNNELGLDIALQENQIEFVDYISKMLDKKSSIALVYDKEEVTEAYGFLEILKQKGFNVIQGKPKDLYLKEKRILLQESSCSQFILELDRMELLNISDDIIKMMTSSCTCINDVRTLILIHDKRVLAVLNQDSIMQEILTDEELTFLKLFLIPTFSLEQPESINIDFMDRNQNWIFKQNSGGKGIDLYESAKMTDVELADFLNEKKTEYMAQYFVDQAKFDTPEPNHFVGFTHYYNDKSFGAGTFRGGLDPVINVSGHRGKFYPTVFR